MTIEFMLAVAVGALGAVACSVALAAALTIKTWRHTFGPESLLLLAVALVSAWCVVEALYLQASFVQFVLMLVAAWHAIRMMHFTSRARAATGAKHAAAKPAGHSLHGH